MGIFWAIIIGFLAGLIAKWITPGDNKPQGFILTTVLGIVGSVVATWLGQRDRLVWAGRWGEFHRRYRRRGGDPAGLGAVGASGLALNSGCAVALAGSFASLGGDDFAILGRRLGVEGGQQFAD